MDSLRARLSRRAQQRRIEEAQVEGVDADAVERFWLNLAAEERWGVLRFTDKVLVQRLHGYMNSLCHMDLFCNRNGQGSPSERLRGFGFERAAELNCYGRCQAPTAFCATEELAESDAIFEELARHLGGRLLQGRPALRRQHWAAVVEATPDSWEDLQVQAMRLVELAIFDSYQGAVASGAVPPPAAAACAVVSAPAAAQDSTAAPSASAKRRARKKKRAAVGARQLAEGGQEDEDDDAADVEEAAVPESTAAPVDLAGEAQEEADQQEAEAVGRRSSYGTLWSNWFPNILRDGSAEWNWMVFQRRTDNADAAGSAQQAQQPVASGIRAFVKHTFVDVEDPQDGQTATPKRRAKSVFF